METLTLETLRYPVGRFVLPEYLRKYASITNDIVYVGIERFFEIWDKHKWEEQEKKSVDTMTSIAEKLGNE